MNLLQDAVMIPVERVSKIEKEKEKGMQVEQGDEKHMLTNCGLARSTRRRPPRPLRNYCSYSPNYTAAHAFGIRTVYTKQKKYTRTHNPSSERKASAHSPQLAELAICLSASSVFRPPPCSDCLKCRPPRRSSGPFP
ncbi:uncharacterized protein MYCFIDRAFT_176622 [Pseudocercospora fijiensis CIRAD86]|uniref:Uncharacterized protein n=1 Tax=Pseudocercospora fijiensis (strain CIRAD86) TaxID=383855 RepID=M3AV18_PSEFD|nr:uncharacterized protein MYCFIDRAFT_176622 [Pseudocercospora fijiensis CIRAD86]EME81337.1 hypothetical protein MYCFIDRAFT_176622 [Pseudocercospora fijiensis CIRAD86]